MNKFQVLARTSAVLGVAASLTASAAAQLGRGGSSSTPTDDASRPRVESTDASVKAKADARIDMTGYWVSIVTEDWRWRMVTPEKGDYASIPMTVESRKVADLWDPAKDEATGNACKAYGVGGLSRIPGRLHITWQDDNTLKIETDAGQQTRLLHFGGTPPPGKDLGWQGYSVATWQGPKENEQGPRGGALKVVTTKMKAGYLRKNGVPYSDNAVISEYWHRTKEANGDDWLIVSTIVEDPQYLLQPFITSTHFKKEANNAKWNPQPCSAK